jgi:hypothetical protein
VRAVNLPNTFGHITDRDKLNPGGEIYPTAVLTAGAVDEECREH